MTEIILSIRKEWARRILKRQKTVELRKSRPRWAEGGHYRLYLYETAAGGGAGAVVGECVCYYITGPLTRCPEFITLAEGSMMPPGKIAAYARGRPIYGWFLGGVTEYGQARPLSDFGVGRAPQSWCYMQGRH